MKICKQWKHVIRTLRVLWQLDKTVLIAGASCSFLESSIPYIEIYLSAYVLDQLTGRREIVPFLQTVFLVLGGILVMRMVIAYLKKLVAVHTERCGKKFDMLLGLRTLTMDYELLESPKTNELRTRIMEDSQWGFGIYAVLGQFPMLIASVANFIFAVVILIPLFVGSALFKDYPALILILGFLAIIAFRTYFVGKKRKQIHTIMDEVAKDFGYRGYYIWNRQDYRQGKDIRIFKGQKVIENYLQTEHEHDMIWKKRFVSISSQSGLSEGICSGLLQVSAYLFVAIRALAGTLSVGSVMKYASVIYRFSNAISDVCQILAEFGLSAKRQQATLDYINIEDVLPKGSIPVEKRAFCEKGDNEYEIELRNVSFRYPGSDNWVLRNVSLKLHIGERLAIVGMNGSGKTTLIKLLCRLYDPTEGCILLNGVDIRKYDYEEYISLFSVVFQDFKLFAFSLGTNVAASAEFDKEKVVNSLKKAGFGKRFASLPDGENTYLYKGFDEQGVEISGGEAQKIALARALYKDAPFIVLDEPTAALDPIAEYDIYNRFNEFVENKTAIYISHRLSSCRFCNDIAVFHEGRLIQRGSHDTLLADSGGKYCEMWNAQAQYYET